MDRDIRFERAKLMSFGRNGSSYTEGLNVYQFQSPVYASTIVLSPINSRGKRTHGCTICFPKSAIPDLIAALTEIGLEG